ncbi:YkvA family protein [Salinibacter sp.]|uniref:YkvA family protein n=1 Tax=Salinibacter sp. TaxID=2065818 RepID=UPI0021E8FD5A|nr:YkvA family protein [Salinibacter sp.]
MADGQPTPSPAPQGDPPEDSPPASVLARLRERIQGVRDTRLADRLAQIDAEFVRKNARRITEADLDTVVDRAEAIEARFRNDGGIRRLLDEGRLLLSLVRDVRRGRYRALPVWTLSAAGFALLYVLNPFDLVPDALPVVGLLDDAAVVSACLSLVEQDLRDYQAWRRAGRNEEDPTDRDASGPDPSSS